MGDESDVATYKVVQMGADNNPTATSRLVTLQTRKQQLEERITLKNKELRRLCIQEAELTGVMPPEIPLEPGEILPTFRRRVGTAFEYPQNIVNSLSNEVISQLGKLFKEGAELQLFLKEDETVPALETKIQVQKKIAEAALQLANNATISKSIRRKNMSLYRQTKQQLDFMEERLKTIKIQGKPLVASSNSQNQQLKQKKKPRPLLEADTISTKSSNPSQSEETSINRNLVQPVHQRDQNRTAERYILANKYNTFNNANSYLSEGDLHNPEVQSYHVSEDNLIPPLSKLSLNNYDRTSIEESSSPHMQPSYSHSSPNIYHQQHQQQFLTNSQTLPHMSPNQYQRSAASTHYPSHSHTLLYPNSRIRCHPDDRNVFRISYNQDTYPYYNTSNSHPILMHLSPQNYKQLGYMDPNHHILSHQQYEPEVVSSAGLGGHWVKTENGDMIWCPTLHDDVANAWHTDKRFGSLDRRKAKHIRNKRTSPNLDLINKQPVPVRPVLNSQDIPRPMTLQPVPIATRSERHDNRQLVRTQSLGSVGAQTVDSVWPSDDNSSYDSDGHSISELNTASRKLKQKGWCETSLDGPTVVQNTVQEEARSPPQQPIPSPVVLSPSSMSMRTPRPILEIPAESNPSPMHLETNIEMFNSPVLTDLPKNCTVVQAGQCKPYREVTKPFEMSDFYKYSTKFRERNQDKIGNKNENGNVSQDTSFGALPRNGADNGPSQEDIYQKGVYQPLQPMKCQPLNTSNTSFNRYLGSPCPDNVNSSMDSNLGLNTSNVAVAEHFSAEMNAWYQTHSHGEPRIDNNNSSTSPVPLGRSTATLV